MRTRPALPSLRMINVHASLHGQKWQSSRSASLSYQQSHYCGSLVTPQKSDEQVFPVPFLHLPLYKQLSASISGPEVMPGISQSGIYNNYSGGMKEISPRAVQYCAYGINIRGG
jgi:hypothetical protein